MNKTLALLFASTALAAAVAIPAWSMVQPTGERAAPPFAAFAQEVAAQTLPVLASADDDDHDNRHRESARRGHDNDDEEDEDEDEDGDDDRGGARNPAPAGTMAPPQNGLFGNGAPPQVQVN